MDFLLYVENAAENLQFYLWFRDYVARFEQLPESEKSLSPPWHPQPRGPKKAATAANPLSEMTVDEKRKAEEEVSTALKGTDFEAPGRLTICEIKDNPFYTPPVTPGGERPSMDRSTTCWSEEMSMFQSGAATSHTTASANAFQAAKALQPCKLCGIRCGSLSY
jgi:hypothetical protein